MKNKIILLFVSTIIFLSSVSFVKAQTLLQATISITVNAYGGNGLFNYDQNGFPAPVLILQTQNNTATGTYGTISSINYVEVTQENNPSFKLDSILCVSDDPTETFIYLSNGVAFSSISGNPEKVSCVFNNTKRKTPVLIVPGLLGTEMKKGNELLWADPLRMLTDIGDSFMDLLSFNKDLASSDSAVAFSDIIRSVSFLRKYDYTDGLIAEFKNQGYVENQTLFTFPYDWRYGVSGKFTDGKTNSDLLAKKIQDILTQTGAQKIDVVAHSLGGLIVKQYAINHLTDNHIGKAVFVGVPNTGAPKAIKVLLQGDSFGIPWLSQNEIKKISENMPAAYDLLPTQRYYDVKGSFLEVVDEGRLGDFNVSAKDLNYSEFGNFLTSDHGLNSPAFTSAQTLHTQNYDNFDLRAAGINLYAIDGCKAGTIGKIIEDRYKNIFGQSFTEYKTPKFTPGDGTVPLESATNLPIDPANKYYALVSDHGKMPSENGIRQKIVNVISGSNLNTGKDTSGNDLITQDISQCNLNGKAISVFSPVDIFTTDQQQNTLGLASDGSVVSEIPNADFEMLGDHKFVYLPQYKGQVYDIKIKGTNVGTYTIKSQDIQNGKIIKAEIFSNLPVTPQLTGQINISPTDNNTTLSVTQNTGGTPVIVLPSQVLDYATDKTAPEAIMAFNPSAKDLAFAGIDNMSDIFSVSVLDNGNTVTLTDEAGNVTEIGFKERNRKSSMSAVVSSLKYNGVPVNINRNSMAYSWSFDNFGKLVKLSQKAKSAKNYSILAVYDGVNTVITGTDSLGKISKSFSGLKIIKINTNKEDLQWSY